jgi:hypothetical protein
LGILVSGAVSNLIYQFNYLYTATRPATEEREADGVRRRLVFSGGERIIFDLAAGGGWR